jgi:hypothetical protein
MFVPLHIQENWYYCGPASTLMALDFMNVDGGADQDDLWAEVGVSSSSGSDSTLIAAALNSRQSTNYYIGGYYNMSGVNMSGFEYRWHCGFDHSTPAIPNIDTDQLSSYGGTNYEHFVTANGYDWGDGLVRYHDPNNLMHGGAYWDPQQDMLDAIQLRNSGLQSMVW